MSTDAYFHAKINIKLWTRTFRALCFMQEDGTCSGSSQWKSNTAVAHMKKDQRTSQCIDTQT